MGAVFFLHAYGLGLANFCHNEPSRNKRNVSRSGGINKTMRWCIKRADFIVYLQHRTEISWYRLYFYLDRSVCIFYTHCETSCQNLTTCRGDVNIRLME